MREGIFEAIEEGKVDYTLFDKAQAHALSLLRFSVFPMWKASKEYQALMKKHNMRDLRDLTSGKRGRKLSGRDDLLELETK